MKTRNLKPLALIALAALVGGCGANSSTKKSAATTGTATSTTTGNNNGWIYPTPTPPPNGNLSAPHSYSGTITGFAPVGGSGAGVYTLQSPPTDSILKIRIQPTAGAYVSVPGYGNYSFTPQCAQYKVTVGGETIQTNVLRVAGTSGSNSCYGAADSQVVDFSGRIGSGGPVTIKIAEARYDIYCQMWYSYYWAINYQAYSSMCPMKNVYSNHTVNFNLRVGTNYTHAP